MNRGMTTKLAVHRMLNNCCPCVDATSSTCASSTGADRRLRPRVERSTSARESSERRPNRPRPSSGVPTRGGRPQKTAVGVRAAPRERRGRAGLEVLRHDAARVLLAAPRQGPVREEAVAPVVEGRLPGAPVDHLLELAVEGQHGEEAPAEADDDEGLHLFEELELAFARGAERGERGVRRRRRRRRTRARGPPGRGRGRRG